MGKRKERPSLGDRILGWQGLLVALIAATGAVLAAWIGASGDDGGEPKPGLQVSSVTFARAGQGTLLLRVNGTHSGLPEPRDIYAIAAPADGTPVHNPIPAAAELCAARPDDRAACESDVTDRLESCALQDDQAACVDQLLSGYGSPPTTASWLVGLARESGQSWAANIDVPQETALPLTVRAVYVTTALDCPPGLVCGPEPVDDYELAIRGPEIADGSSPAVTSPSAPD